MARSCYDHLAGRLGVAVTAALLGRRVLVATDGIDDTTRRPGDRLAAALPAHPYGLARPRRMYSGTLGATLHEHLGLDASAA